MATKEAAGRPVFATPPTPQQLHELALRVSSPADYVDRRTSTISYPGTEDVIRRVTLDTSVPSEELPEVGSVSQETLVAFPIGFAQRGSSLTGFSLTVNEEAASLLTRIENEELTRGVILALMPESVNQAQPVVRAAETLVGADDASTARDAAAQLLFEAAQAHPEGKEFLTAVLDEDDQGIPQRGLRALLARLLTNYVMYVRVPNGVGRVLIAREVDHQHPEEAPEDLDEWWSRQAERWLLKWPEAAINPEAADARSTHLEASLPEGLTPVVPARDGHLLGDPTLLQTYPGQEPQPTGVPGTTSGRSVHFTSHSRQPVPEEAEARFRFRLAPGGWLVQSALLTVGVAVVASLVTLAYTKSLADPTRPFVEGSGVLSVGMALLSVAIALLARSGHELVARTQGNYRGLHLGLSAVTFIAAVSTAFPGQVPGATGSATMTQYDTVWVHTRWLIWLGTALYAWSFALLQAAGWALRRLPDKRRPWWGALQVTIAVGTLTAMLSGTPRDETVLAGLGAWGLAYAARAAILRQAASQLARRTVRVSRIAGQ